MIKIKHPFLCCLFLLSFLVCITSHADVVEIYDIQKTDLEGVFTLLNDLTETEAVIDCVSFINNLTVKQIDKSTVYNISHNECMSDLEYFMETPDKRRCINFSESGYFLSDCTGL